MPLTPPTPSMTFEVIGKNATAAMPPATNRPLYSAGMIPPPGLTLTKRIPTIVAKIVTAPSASG